MVPEQKKGMVTRSGMTSRFLPGQQEDAVVIHQDKAYRKRSRLKVDEGKSVLDMSLRYLCNMKVILNSCSIASSKTTFRMEILIAPLLGWL